jgi:hypothetical protein
MDDHEILKHIDDIIYELTARGATEAGRLSAAVKLGGLRQRIAAWISECEEIEAEVGAPV